MMKNDALIKLQNNLLYNILTVLITFLFLSCHGKRPDNIGIRQNRLAPCPATPNCISTQADPGDSTHYTAPLKLEKTAATTLDAFSHVITNLERAQIISRTTNYLYAEFTSKVWKFVDDVEIYIDESAGYIHIRSASRLGKSDLGVNRQRVDLLKENYQAYLKR